MAELAFPLDSGYTDAATFLSFLAPMLTNSGVLTSAALTVAPQGSPDMTVKVSGSNDALNMAVFITATGAVYVGRNTANKNVTITTNTSGVTKTDAIVAYIDLAGGVDNVSTPNNPGALKFIAVRRSGTNTGVPTDGEIDTATSNNPWITLATVSVINNATAISSATDVRIAAWLNLNSTKQSVNHQGGSSSIWATTGTSNFLASNGLIQSGSIATSSGGPVTVTFPIAYDNAPIVVASRATTGGSVFAMAEVHDVTSSSFQIDVFNASNTRLADAAQWIAIGPKA